MHLAAEGVKLAKSHTQDVEFSPEDASRTEPEFLAQVVETVIAAGATTVNIADTVGFAVPGQFGALIKYLKDNVRNIDDAVISVHCHNDLGLAVANSLVAVQNGARQIEGTINGIGERAGNAALEEVVMALKTRADFFGSLHTGVETKEILKTSRIVSRMSGLQVQRSKAIVGENAFAHSSGIHQDGILKKRETYEIMDPIEVGWGGTELPLTKHSGRHAMVARLEYLGYKLSHDEVVSVFSRFKEIGDKKKFVYDDDLSAIVDDSMMPLTDGWQLVKMEVTVATELKPKACVLLSRGGEASQGEAEGNGAVDAAMRAIDTVVVRCGNLVEYNVQAVTQGHDALGEVTLKVDFGDARLITGKGASTDVVEASARAYLNAINRTFIRRELSQPVQSG